MDTVRIYYILARADRNGVGKTHNLSIELSAIHDMELRQRVIDAAKWGQITLSNYVFSPGAAPEPDGLLSRYGTPATVQVRPYYADHELTGEEALNEYVRLDDDRQRFRQQADALNAERQPIIARMKDEEKRRAEERETAQQAARQRIVDEAPYFDWDEKGEAIANLYHKITVVADVEMDNRFRPNFVKQVEWLDREARGALVFVGPFVNDQTMLVYNKHAVYLVMGTSGSTKHHKTTAQIVVLDAGRLKKTDIVADCSDVGWPLLIRDQVQSLLTAGAAEVVEKETTGIEEWQRDVQSLYAAIRATDGATVTVDRNLLLRVLDAVK